MWRITMSERPEQPVSSQPYGQQAEPPASEDAARDSHQIEQVYTPGSAHLTERPGSKRVIQAVAGTGALILGLVSLLVPSPYILESPGPTFNTTGDVEGVPILTVEGEETYETDGALELTTVYVNGAPTGTVRVPDMVLGWFSSTTDMLPQELVYPSGTTADQVEQMNTQAMASSQDLALAAALEELGIEYHQELSIMQFTPEALDLGAADLLEQGDQVIAADGEEITGLEGLRTVVTDAAGQPVDLTVVRDGETLDVEVPTYQDADGEWYIGLMLQGEFDFPVDVEIQLQHVGGPSAGLMFTLGLVDTMTEESMTGGEHWAGSGTVDPDGTVGDIGGIAQKVVGARDAGAEHFLVPRRNCPELEGRLPSGVAVYGVETVAEARSVVEAVRDGEAGPIDALEPCGS